VFVSLPSGTAPCHHQREASKSLRLNTTNSEGFLTYDPGVERDLEGPRYPPQVLFGLSTGRNWVVDITDSCCVVGKC
jgi:hypothetical protein